MKVPAEYDECGPKDPSGCHERRDGDEHGGGAANQKRNCGSTDHVQKSRGSRMPWVKRFRQRLEVKGAGESRVRAVSTREERASHTL